MLTLQSGFELLMGIGGCLYAIAQIKATAESNKKGLETLAEDNKRSMESLKADLTNLITSNNESMSNLFESFKMHTAENLEREVRHLKDLLEANSRETRADIQRLESRQNESNHVKERIALAEASIRSLHKRLDIIPDIPLRGSEE